MQHPSTLDPAHEHSDDDVDDAECTEVAALLRRCRAEASSTSPSAEGDPHHQSWCSLACELELLRVVPPEERARGAPAPPWHHHDSVQPLFARTLAGPWMSERGQRVLKGSSGAAVQ